MIQVKAVQVEQQVEEEEFKRRSEYEPPVEGYEPDRLMMCEEIIEIDEEPEPVKETKPGEAQKAEVSSDTTDFTDETKDAHNENDASESHPNNTVTNATTNKEKEMGLFRKNKDDDNGYEEEVIIEEEEEIPDEEAKPVRKGKKARPPKKKTRLLPILLVAGLAVLVGVGYVAYEMMSQPAPMQTYKPPVKPRIHPQEKRATARPVPASPAQQSAQSLPSSASEIAALDLAGQVAGNNPVTSRANPSPISGQSRGQQPTIVQGQQPVMVPDNTAISPDLGKKLENGMRDIGNKLDEIKNTLQDLRGSNAATQINGAVSKDILKEMTKEIQTLSAKNKSLNGELVAANKKITELRGMINKNGKKTTREKEKSAPKATASKSKSSANSGAGTSSWEILGFSGNRVVIADENGTHSVNVGQSLNGIKIISVDVEGGSVKTSSGILKYGQ